MSSGRPPSKDSRTSARQLTRGKQFAAVRRFVKTPAEVEGLLLKGQPELVCVRQTQLLQNRKSNVTRLLKSIFITGLITAASATHASAASIGPDCGTCQGSIYTLTNLGLAPIDLNSADGSFDTWRIALTIDTSGYTGAGVAIDEIAIKVSDKVNQASMVDAPGAVGSWQLLPGGLDANGCTGSGSGFDCSDWIGIGSSPAIVHGPLLTWVLDVDVASPLLQGFDQASIKVRYVDSSGNKVGALVSENITVPEPGTWSLLALGVAATLFRRRLA
jgi:hypothetical protein